MHNKGCNETISIGEKMNKTKRISITLLSLIGLALSIELCIVFYNANFAANAAPSICAINETFDCDSVAKTAYSQFLGVPLSLWGLCLYLFILFMTFVDKIQNIKFLGFLKVFKNPASYIFCISLLSFVLSMILGCISIFKINSICVFCFMTYFVDLLIALFAKTWGSGVFFELKNSVSDFIEAVKVRRYAFWFTLLVLLFASVLVYTSTTNILSPQIIKKQIWENTFKEYTRTADGNTLGPKDASVVIHEYIDFNCPGCFFANLYLHRILSEFENVKITQHVLPLQKSCNHNMVAEGHENSCLKAGYAFAAAKQNRYWDMSDILFIENPRNEKEILEHARLVNFDIKKLKEDANNPLIKEELEAAVAEADKKEITGTPTLFVGMKKLVGVGSYPEFKQIVIEQGGIEKQKHD